jgi:hypothetical protein
VGGVEEERLEGAAPLVLARGIEADGGLEALDEVGQIAPGVGEDRIAIGIGRATGAGAQNGRPGRIAGALGVGGPSHQCPAMQRTKATDGASRADGRVARTKRGFGANLGTSGKTGPVKDRQIVHIIPHRAQDLPRIGAGEHVGEPVGREVMNLGESGGELRIGDAVLGGGGKKPVLAEDRAGLMEGGPPDAFDPRLDVGRRTGIQGRAERGIDPRVEQHAPEMQQGLGGGTRFEPVGVGTGNEQHDGLKRAGGLERKIRIVGNAAEAVAIDRMTVDMGNGPEDPDAKVVFDDPAHQPWRGENRRGIGRAKRRIEGFQRQARMAVTRPCHAREYRRRRGSAQRGAKRIAPVASGVNYVHYGEPDIDAERSSDRIRLP